jgi:DNA-binding NarL/FixJ family response regulator
VELVISPVSRSSRVSAWIVTRPAAPVEPGLAALLMPVNASEPLPSTRSRPAVTIISPAPPGPKVVLEISPPPRMSSWSACTVTRPAAPVEPGLAAKLTMPVMDGLEATRRLRALGIGVPIVALTATPAERTALRAGGFNGCLAKPVSAAALRAAIATTLASLSRQRA